MILSWDVPGKIGKAVYSRKAYKSAVRRLMRERPFCPYCAAAGFPEVMGVETDHIVPLKDGGAPYRLSNLQRICRHHHQRKTARENSRNRKRAVPLTDDRGRPLSPDA